MNANLIASENLSILFVSYQVLLLIFYLVETAGKMPALLPSASISEGRLK